MATRKERLGRSVGGLVGRLVRVRGFKRIARIVGIYRDIDGGIILNRTIDGFRSWNIQDCEFVSERSPVKIVKRRASCEGCRCYRNGTYSEGCAAGFKTELRDIPSPIHPRTGKRRALFPSEPCPRPTNYQDYSDAMHYEWEQRQKRHAVNAGAGISSGKNKGRS